MYLYLQKDKASDQVYIGVGGRRLLRNGSVKRTIRVSDEIALDFDKAGRLVGIDIGHASNVLGRQVFADGFSGDELIGVAEAARLCGVRKPNFLRDYASRPDFPDPIAELDSGRIWRRSDVEAFLKSKSRTRKLRHIA